MITEFLYEENEDIYDIKMPSIYLAGPNNSPDNFSASWRNEALNMLEDLKFNGRVYIPEVSDNNQYYKNDYTESDKNKWIYHHMDNADIILFWFPNNIVDIKSYIDFSYMLGNRHSQVVLGYPESDEKIEYMKYLYDLSNDYGTTHRLDFLIIKALKILISFFSLENNDPKFVSDIITYDKVLKLTPGKLKEGTLENYDIR